MKAAQTKPRAQYSHSMELLCENDTEMSSEMQWLPQETLKGTSKIHAKFGRARQKHAKNLYNSYQIF